MNRVSNHTFQIILHSSFTILYANPTKDGKNHRLVFHVHDQGIHHLPMLAHASLSVWPSFAHSLEKKSQ